MKVAAIPQMPHKEKVTERLEQNVTIIGEIFDRESDRGCVVLSTEMLAHSLESLLRVFFRSDPQIVKKTINPLFKGFGPLATLSAKIELSYGIGLVPYGLYKKLHIARELRNLFAHTPTHLDLSSPKCSPLLKKFTNVEIPDNMDGIIGKQGLTRKQFTDRLLFLMHVMAMSAILVSLEEKLKLGLDARLDVIAHERERFFE